MRPRQAVARILAGIIVMLVLSVPAFSGVHLWRVEEIFSNSAGNIQFIELATCCGSTGEVFTSGQALSSNSSVFTFPNNQVGTTLNKHLLLGTPDYAALPGAPKPDYSIPANFFSTGGDTISFSVYDTMIFAAGALPTDGTHSLNKDPNDATDTAFVAVNSPINFLDAAGSVNAAGGPPAVPDGTAGSTPLAVSSATPDAANLRLAFDVRTCTNAAAYHIVYGQRTGFPPATGGQLTPLGGACGIGTTSPYDWLGVPQPNDGFGLLWFVVVATDTTGVEGSWGIDSAGNEETGPGNGGSDGVCAVVKNTANRCGHL